MGNKNGAIELSIGTIVIIVLAMSMLILGLILVKNIFTGANYNVDQMNEKVKNEIGKLFVEDTRVLVYLPNGVAKIKQGDSWGVGFAIQNSIAAQKFSWDVEVADSGVVSKCGVSELQVQKWITTGVDGDAQIASGQKFYDIIRFNIPEGEVSDVSSCILRYHITVLKEDKTPYQTVSFDVDVE